MSKTQDYVYAFPTKSEVGFAPDEIDKVLADHPEVDREKFDNALRGVTCMVIDGIVRIYHCDVELALRCGLEKRKPKSWEWD